MDAIGGFFFVSLVHFGIVELLERNDCYKFRNALKFADIVAVLMMGVYTVLVLEAILQ